jgi:ABC-2 type transport system permease protein
MAGGFLAVGCFFSAITKNQVISFILSVAGLAILVYAGMPTTLDYMSGFMPEPMISTMESMSFLGHFESIQKGIIQLKDIIYFAVMICGWLTACTIVLNERKAS